MELDAIFLSRLQFAFTLGFHIIFPTLTLGLAPFLVLLEVLWMRTGTEIYMRLYRFWAKLFGLAFGMGVVTGVVLSFEFGTNFAPFSQATGNVLGPLLAYEVLMAFFLEAGFLPVMLLGWGRVGVRLHLFATCMVALGTVLSAFWILAANSWMHTPAGFTVKEGIFFPADWWQVVFNPSFPYRLAHMLTAAFLTGAFVVAGVSAWRLLQREQEETSRRAFSLAMGAAAVFSAGQIALGDLHGLQVQRDQPMKVGGHGGPLADAASRTSGGVRAAGHGRLGQPLCAGDPLRDQSDSQARPAGHRARPRSGYRGRAAACADRVLCLPHHGGDRLPAVRRCRGGAGPAPARDAL